MTRNFIANEIKRRIAAISVLRQERVDDLKQRLEAGTYVIRTDLVARALLREQLLDEIVLYVYGRYWKVRKEDGGSVP